MYSPNIKRNNPMRIGLSRYQTIPKPDPNFFSAEPMGEYNWKAFLACDPVNAAQMTASGQLVQSLHKKLRVKNRKFSEHLRGFYIDSRTHRKDLSQRGINLSGYLLTEEDRNQALQQLLDFRPKASEKRKRALRKQVIRTGLKFNIIAPLEPFVDTFSAADRADYALDLFARNKAGITAPYDLTPHMQAAETQAEKLKNLRLKSIVLQKLSVMAPDAQTSEKLFINACHASLCMTDGKAKGERLFTLRNAATDKEMKIYLHEQAVCHASMRMLIDDSLAMTNTTTTEKESDPALAKLSWAAILDKCRRNWISDSIFQEHKNALAPLAKLSMAA